MLWLLLFSKHKKANDGKESRIDFLIARGGWDWAWTVVVVVVASRCNSLFFLHSELKRCKATESGFNFHFVAVFVLLSLLYIEILVLFLSSSTTSPPHHQQQQERLVGLYGIPLQHQSNMMMPTFSHHYTDNDNNDLWRCFCGFVPSFGWWSSH